MLKRLLFMLSISLGTGSAYAQYLDSSFASYGIATTTFTGTNEYAAKVLVQSDGKVLAGGTTSGNAGKTEFILARYDTSGVLDNTFGTAGKVVTPNGGTDNQLTDLAILSNGKIFAVGIAKTGAFSPWSTMLVKYNANGTIDNTFGTAGIVTTQVGQKCDAYNVVVQTDGKILICGTEYANSFYILIRYNTDGTLDNTFGVAGIVTGTQFGTGVAIALQPDGKIILTGEFWGMGPHAGMVRHNTNGTLDNTFGTAGVVIIPSPYADDLWGGHDVKVLPNGKILVPLFLQSNTIAQEPAIVRYNANGTVDQSFGMSGFAKGSYCNFYEKGEEMAIQPDGKILLAGYIQGQGVTIKDSLFVMRFDTSGAPDLTFSADGRITARLDTGGSRLSSIILQSNGKFLVAGSNGNNNAKKFIVARYKYAPDVSVGVNEKTNSIKNTLTIYPNPATDDLSIQLNEDEKATVTITDIAGKIVSQQNISTHSNSINIKTLSKGSYIVSIERNGIKHTALFEKQ